MVENICAIATPYGTGAISIIRCSGPDAITLVNNIFKGPDLTKVKSHTINYGHIVDNGKIIDEVLCNVYIGPNSFDGENMVEINCHGGVFVTNKVLTLLLTSGFRLAERGEFSKRAFLNQKLDLTQAEAIMDIISSNTDIALNASNDSLRKSTKRLVSKFRDSLLDLIAKIEVNIDYPEYDDAVVITNEYLKPVIDNLLTDMNQIIKNSEISTVAIHGIKTAIVGKPNVGKSSLLNLLLEEDKAIVSDIAGTTRDIVEGTIVLGNVTLNLLDTAGIHEAAGIEAIGINKSQEAINKADLILLVLDSSKPLDNDDYKLLELTKDKKRIIIANKKDLAPSWRDDEALYISTFESGSINILQDKILEITKINELNNLDGNYLNNARQVSLLTKAYNSLIEAKKGILSGRDVELIEIDIKDAFDYLGEITGEANPEELITALFTKFCLGK